MSKKKIIIGIVCVLITLAAVYCIYHVNSRGKNYIAYEQFLKDVKDNKVSEVFLSNSHKIKVLYRDGKTFFTDNPRKDSFKEELLLQGVMVDEVDNRIQLVRSLVSLAVLATVLYVVLFRMKSLNYQMQKESKKLSNIDANKIEGTDILFDDIAGNDEAKESVKELVDFINNPEKYAKYGARLPRGVIFYGPPGTGKTLLAKAVAGEAGVPFYAMSGSDFVQLYVGVGASRIRDLFKKAREKGKCVIFIDEIDALGKKRDNGMDGGGNDERDQTLNALLTEMSGFNDNDGIVVIAATNRLDILDDALLRPGRFDRHIEIGLPDKKGRYEILKLHTLNKPISDDVELYDIAEQTVYFSGAMLESMMNEAAICAARRDSGVIEKEDIDKAFYTVIAGAEKKDRSGISKRDREITAYHEGGHALITKLIAPANRVTKVTIIPSTKGAGGFSMNISPDSMYHRKVDLENNIKIALGGRAAEELVFGRKNITTGAVNDLEKATQIILNMVKRFGMDDSIGLLNYDILRQNGINIGNESITEHCKRQLKAMYEETKGLLAENRAALDGIARALIERETIEEQDLDILIRKYSVCA
ncbi:MAG TPA: ATP-dependent zinc metalloprotease FtsH [Clostridiales bacterium]|nr:ATP-dependent zinc metalloprotease FtsH [Clostridiales bacterium]